jgi:L-lactate dehydrogenase (cytochrome)
MTAKAEGNARSMPNEMSSKSRAVPDAPVAPAVAPVTGGAMLQGLPASGPRRLRHILSLDDFETAAKRHLPRPIFGFVAGASETNATWRDNRAAFQDYGFVPRGLVDTSKRSQATELFGRRYAAPFGIPPMGIAAIAAYRADLVLARAAARCDIPFILSGSSLIRLEDVIRENPDSWFQAYLPGEETRIFGLVDRVAGAGFKTLVVTIDVPVSANRENNIRNGFTTPLRPSLRLAWDGLIRPRWLVNTWFRTLLRHGMPHFENSYATRGAPILSRDVARDFGARDHLSWRHLELIRKRWHGKLALKGVMNKEDARIARESGVDGVLVSNHGGRQLDGTVSPLRVLPEIAELAGPMTVMFDSGVRRGTDVLKALALGAQFVFVGRPFLFAASIAGQAGAEHAAGILSQEINRDMALLGISALDQMKKDLLLPLRKN